MFKKLLQTVLIICSTSIILNAQCPSPGTAGGSDITVCLGNDATMAATLPNGFTGTWTKLSFFQFETITTASDPNTAVTGFSFATTVSEIWTITDGANCKNIKDTVKITIINGATSANAGSDKTACAGDSAILGATLVAGSAGVWSIVNGKNSSTINIVDPTNKSSKVGGLFMTGTDTLMWTVSNTVCSSVNYTDIMVITTDSLPSQAIAGSDVTGCIGDTITLIGSVATNGSPVWSRVGATFLNANNLRFIPNPNNDTVKIVLGASGTYTLYYTISTSPNSLCSSQDTLIVTVSPGPTTANISGAATITVCDTASTFTLNANTPAAGETGVWSILNGAPGTLTPNSATSVTVSGLPKGVTTVVWTITGSNGCTSSDKVKITVGASTGGVDLYACVGDTNFQISGSWSFGWTSSWSFQGSAGASFVGSSSSASASLSISAAGTINLLYTIDDGNGCTSMDTLTIIAQDCSISVGVNDINENMSSALSVYPNPTEGVFTITMNDSERSNAEIVILTPEAQIVLAEKLGPVKDIKKQIDLSGMAKGIYFVRVTKGGYSTFNKLVVQ